MCNAAKQKKNYHKTLINAILNRYNDPEDKNELIEQRMSTENVALTTHMSLKQALKKNKNMTRTLKEARSERAKRIRQTNVRAPAQKSQPDSDDEVKQQIKPYDDVPIIDMMKGKMAGVLHMIDPAMKKTIGVFKKEQNN